MEATSTTLAILLNCGFLGLIPVVVLACVLGALKLAQEIAEEIDYSLRSWRKI